MIKKLIIIGVDGMDYDVVRAHGTELPNLNRLLANNGYAHMRSAFPADTTPAWSTIFTGLDPTEHGIINFVNAGDHDNTYKGFEFDDSSFKGKTFWDKLNNRGYSTTVLLPMNIKYGWEINGLLITRPYMNEMRVYPAKKQNFYKPNAKTLGSELQYTTEKQNDAVRDDFRKKFEEEYRLTKHALENEDSDVFFSYFSVIDGIQHAFWRYSDPSHPEYPGETKYKNVILNMYREIDNMLAEFEKMQPGVPLLVISDHGHGARPVFSAKINEMLRREGYLTPKKQLDGRNEKKCGLKKKLRSAAVGFVRKFGLPRPMIAILKKVPLWKKLFVSSEGFDWEHTTAYLSDLSAMKNYSYGGIRVKVPPGRELDEFCEEIIGKLKNYRIFSEDKPAFLWIRRTNTLYHGEYLTRYPEIIFQLDERYGASWDLSDKLFDTKSMMHQFSPGAHRYETAYIGTDNFKLEKKQFEMTDIFHIILHEVTGK